MARRWLALSVLVLLLTSAPASAPASAQEPLQPVLSDLAFPTNLALSPDGRVFFAEKDTGRIRVIEDGRLLAEPFVTLPSVTTTSETGLLGIALHPGFPGQPWVYATYSDADTGTNRLVRIQAEGNLGVEIEPLLDLLPYVDGYHNGGDLAFGLDGRLYVTTGEAHDPARAQDPADLGGKILRVEPDGGAPPDNPFGGDDLVYALGIRNSFGICVDPVTGDVWETENGPDRFDEVNEIEAGGNYGWPDQLGPGGEPGFADPILAFETVIVPTGCAVAGDGSALFFGTYGGELHRLALPADDTARDEVVANVSGSITDVARAPDGTIWIATSDAIYRFGTASTESPSPSAPTDASGSPGASGSPPASGTPSPSAGSTPLSPAAIILGLVLIGGLFLFRARLPRG